MKAKYEEPRVMKELHEIRAKHYEETKHMTDEEYINRINQEGLEVLKKFNMKLKVTDKH
jgi:protein-disulfide isomerase-like protein with CxxC motif